MTINKEFEFFYKSIFKKNINNYEIESEYENACQFLMNDKKSDEKKIAIDKIIDKNLDLESIEFFLRMFYGDNILSKKINILIFLLEIDLEHQNYFISKNRITYFNLSYILLSHILPLPFKYLKGLYIVWRHSIV